MKANRFRGEQKQNKRDERGGQSLENMDIGRVIEDNCEFLSCPLLNMDHLRKIDN